MVYDELLDTDPHEIALTLQPSDGFSAKPHFDPCAPVPRQLQWFDAGACPLTSQIPVLWHYLNLWGP